MMPELIHTTRKGAQVWRVGARIVRTSPSSVRAIKQIAHELRDAMRRLAAR